MYIKSLHRNSFIYSRACTLHNGFPSSKTKFFHVLMPILSSSFSPWLMSYSIQPSIHPFFHVPFLCFPFQDCVWYSIFLPFSLHLPTIIIVFPITHNIFFPTSTVSLTVSFQNSSFLNFIAGFFQNSISVATSLLACCIFRLHISAYTQKLKIIIFISIKTSSTLR